jgi:hypothetical protein
VPFKSKKQMRKCYYLKEQGKAGNWDCDEWASKTDMSQLPEKTASLFLEKIAEDSFYDELNKLASKASSGENQKKGRSFLKRSIGRTAMSGLTGAVTGGLITGGLKGAKGGALAGLIGQGLKDTLAPKDLFYKAD